MASSLYQNTAPGRPPAPPPPYRQPPPPQPPQPPPPGSFYNAPGYQAYPSHYPPAVPPPPGPPAPGAPPPPYSSSNYGSAATSTGVRPNVPGPGASSQGSQAPVQSSRAPAQGAPASYSHPHSASGPGTSQRAPHPSGSHPPSFHPSGQPVPPSQHPSSHPPHQQPPVRLPARGSGPTAAAHGSGTNPNSGQGDAGQTGRPSNAGNPGQPANAAGTSHAGWGPPNAAHSSGHAGTSSREHHAAVDKNTSVGGVRASQPVPPQQHGRRTETEAERHERKKREYLARKVEERRQREKALAAAQGNTRGSSAAPGKPGPPAANRDPRAEKRAPPVVDKATENRLKRSSTFICKMRFRNELPDPVSQPKLLRPANMRDQYTKYTITSLEKSYKYKLHVDTDLGIPLDLLDISAYKAPKVRPPLDPADAELLLDDEILKKDKPLSIRKKERPTDKGVAWLVKTQYISPVSLDPAKQSLTEKQAKELREMKEGRKEFLETRDDREQQIQTIEKSFEIAKLVPVHQTKPELKAVEIFPLLPDLTRWGDQLVHMVFDNETTGDSEVFAKLPQHIRDDLETRAIVKSYSVPSSDESRPDEKFVGYMVPKLDELDKDPYNEDEEIAYSWVREYHWDVRADDARNTYVFSFGKDDVRYLPLHTKLLLQKKKAREGRSKDELENDFPVPASVTVRYVPPSPEEEETRVNAKRNLMEGRGGASVDQTVRLKRGRSPPPVGTSSKRPAYANRRAASSRRNTSDDDDDVSV